MSADNLTKKAENYLHHLCNIIPNRRVGATGNREATAWYAGHMKSFGFNLDVQNFKCIDWKQEGADLTIGENNFAVHVSPYTLGKSLSRVLVEATTTDELAAAEAEGKILLLRGEIAKEQLMPKNFVFYNPDHHKQIVAGLEAKKPAAIIAATSRDPELAGGMYPFPLIEDGDFDIPSVYMTEEEGARLSNFVGQTAALDIRAERFPATGENVIARKGDFSGKKIVIFAHIDAKDNTPGAVDNGTGVVMLLLLAELLKDYEGAPGIEIVALNGEDYYSAPGQMVYLNGYLDTFPDILLGINMDAAGYKDGATAYSLYNVPEDISRRVHRAFKAQPGMIEGVPWYQSDHGIFIQNGVPALAITSEIFMHLTTHVTHTPKDHTGIIDCAKVAYTALALEWLILSRFG